MADTGTFPNPGLARDLQWWAEREWTGGFDLSTLTGLEQFTIRTRNTTYDLTVLSPANGEVLLRGGRFFPDYTRVQLAGCSMGGSFLKARSVHPGFLMELLHEGQRIVTTRVREIVTVAPPSI